MVPFSPRRPSIGHSDGRRLEIGGHFSDWHFLLVPDGGPLSQGTKSGRCDNELGAVSLSQIDCRAYAGRSMGHTAV